MKDLFAIVVFVSSFDIIMAQTDSSHTKENYLQFKVSQRSFSSKGRYRISINFGQKYLSVDSSERVKSAARIEEFTEISDVLEYMNSIGWKLVTAFATSHEHNPIYYYVMKREP